jgi:hypothetical protein
MNSKYNLEIEESNLDTSDIGSNSWLTGFTEADGNFSIKIRDAKPNTETTKRSTSASVNLNFKISQRSYDRPTSSSMYPIMEKISNFLSCNLQIIKNTNTSLKLEPIDTLIAEVSALNKIDNIITYFNKFPLLGMKQLDFNDWKSVYFMIKKREHLTESGRLKINLIKSNMNSKRNS